MRNEYLLLFHLIFVYGSVLLWFLWFDVKGLYAFTVFATITANIEVLMVVTAFGMEQTLGNILFASTFLITDILSEIAGRKAAQQSVRIGIATSITFIILSQSWLLFFPAKSDWASESMHTLFANTPRIMLSSVLVYAITQAFDVWAYHQWWKFTTKITGDQKRMLWVRNNGSTLISQFFNTLLYTFFAFYGAYDTTTLVQIILSSYLIFILTSLADTPVLYAARKIAEKKKIAAEP